MSHQLNSQETRKDGASIQMFVDGLAFFDWVEWLDRIFGVWFHRPWRRILQRLGFLGLLKELVRTATGQSAWRFAVPRDGGLSGWEIERMLAQYGVSIWGRWFDSDTLYFNVKIEQANWAEYLLKRRGVAVMSTPYNPLNDLVPQRHPSGGMPTPWSERKG